MDFDKVISMLCPQGVEFKEFSEICEYVRGVTYNKSQEAMPGDLNTKKVLRANNITLETNELNFDDVKEISADVKIKPTQYLKKNDILICAGSGSKEHIGKVAYITKNMEYTFGGFMAVIRCSERIMSRFLFHVLTSNMFLEYLKKALNTATINNLNANVISHFLIPLPPLPVQQEIVRILDHFTALTAELTAELTARRKQYEYYRDELLTFGDDVAWKALEEEFPHIRNGFVGTVTSYFSDEEGGVRYLEGRDIHNGTISDEKATYVSKDFHRKHMKTCLKENDILVVQSGHVGECAVVSKKYEGANCHALIVMSNGGNCLSKYVSYYLQSCNGRKQMQSITTGGTVKHILASKIKKIMVPFPPIEEQARIVSILDRFDALCNDLSSGLPAEISARQKQYEYYRDKLLTFKEIQS